MINNVVLVSVVQQSDSGIHKPGSILFQILFPVRLLYNIEQSSLCYIVGHPSLSKLHMKLSIVFFIIIICVLRVNLSMNLSVLQ